jgi:hypothetical protein
MTTTADPTRTSGALNPQLGMPITIRMPTASPIAFCCCLIKLHFASQVIVQKQHMYLGAKTTPPGKSGRALQLPKACDGCGCFTTCTGHEGNSSKRLLKNRPTQAGQHIPKLQIVAV